MQLIVDANVLFAALIKDSFTIEFLLSDSFQLFAPEFVLIEFYKHRKEILEKTKRTIEEFEFIYGYLQNKISIIPKHEYEDLIPLAQTFSPDPDDVAYLALALKLSLPIWSNDRLLKEKQNKIKVYSTRDFVGKLTP